MLSQAAILLTALLFGGMVLYSFGFASFLFSALPADAAGPLLRRAFPHFYVFVIGCALGSAALAAAIDMTSAVILGRARSSCRPSTGRQTRASAGASPPSIPVPCWSPWPTSPAPPR
jgi:hypothetical protein